MREVIDLVLKASGRYGPALVAVAEKAWSPGRRPAAAASDTPPEEIQ